MKGRDPIVAGGHVRIRPFNTAESYPEQLLDNDLCQAVVAGNTVYLRGQVPQDLDTGENVGVGDPVAQAESSATRRRGSVVLWLHTAPTPACAATQRAATAMLAEAMTTPTAPVRSQRPASENVMA